MNQRKVKAVSTKVPGTGRKVQVLVVRLNLKHILRQKMDDTARKPRETLKNKFSLSLTSKACVVKAPEWRLFSVPEF